MPRQGFRNGTGEGPERREEREKGGTWRRNDEEEEGGAEGHRRAERQRAEEERLRQRDIEGQSTVAGQPGTATAEYRHRRVLEASVIGGISSPSASRPPY